MVCLPCYGSTSLDNAVEKLARLIVRARCGSPSCQFVETKDEFGKMKQLMIKLLADSGKTPAMEQASKAAESAFAHLMKPNHDSVLAGVMNDTIVDVRLDEVLASSILGLTIDDLKELDPFIVTSPVEMLTKSATPIASTCVTGNTTNSLLNGTSFSISSSPQAANYASSELVAEQEVKVQELETKIQELEFKKQELESKNRELESKNQLQQEIIQNHEAKIQKQDEVVHQLRQLTQTHTQKLTRLEKALIKNDPGGGTTYANPEEVFKTGIAGIKNLKQDVKGLTDEVTTIDYQVSDQNMRILILEERIKYLETTHTNSEDIFKSLITGMKQDVRSLNGEVTTIDCQVSDLTMKNLILEERIKYLERNNASEEVITQNEPSNGSHEKRRKQVK